MRLVKLGLVEWIMAIAVLLLLATLIGFTNYVVWFIAPPPLLLQVVARVISGCLAVIFGCIAVYGLRE